jgi:triosephosphate isomerase
MNKKIITMREATNEELTEKENIHVGLLESVFKKVKQGKDALTLLRDLLPNKEELREVLLTGVRSWEIKKLLLQYVEAGNRIYNSLRQTGANFKTNTALRVQAAQILIYRIAYDRGINTSGLTVAPSTLLLSWAKSILRGTNIKVIAQDFESPECPELTKEMTGANLTLSQMKEMGIDTVIIMHSELRLKIRSLLLSSGLSLPQARARENEITAIKVKDAITAGMNIKLCIGEHHFERFTGNGSFEGRPYLSKHSGGTEDLGEVEKLITYQLDMAFSKVTAEQVVDYFISGHTIEIANEPIWAISAFGGGKITPEQGEYVNKIVTNWLVMKYGILSTATPVTFGGSVDPEKAPALAAMPHISGSLVGGASFDKKIKEFVETSLAKTDLDEFLVSPKELRESKIYKVLEQAMDENKIVVPSIFQIADQNNMTVRP